MANKNITVAGADYTDVPGVELPVTGGGTAYFAEVSDTTATASDVASGTYFYNSAGVRTAGTASGGGAQNTWYGTSSTGAGTQTKAVTTTTGDFTLATGNMVRVKFANAQTYNGGIKLNVDGTGAVNAMRQGTTVTTRYFYLAGEVVDFVYDGTNFVAVNEGIATTTYYGVTKLSNSTASTSTSLAATANAVKLAYDHADTKSTVSVSQTLTSGTEIGSVTVDGTATTLYAPSGGSAEALTDPEIEEAVEDAFVSATFSIADEYSMTRSITNDGSYGVNVTTKISEADAGSAVTFAVPTETSVGVSTSGGESVEITRVGSYGISEGPMTMYYNVYQFTMPRDSVIITIPQ